MPTDEGPRHLTQVVFVDATTNHYNDEKPPEKEATSQEPKPNPGKEPEQSVDETSTVVGGNGLIKSTPPLIQWIAYLLMALTASFLGINIYENKGQTEASKAQTEKIDKLEKSTASRNAEKQSSSGSQIVESEKQIIDILTLIAAHQSSPERPPIITVTVPVVSPSGPTSSPASSAHPSPDPKPGCICPTPPRSEQTPHPVSATGDGPPTKQETIPKDLEVTIKQGFRTGAAPNNLQKRILTYDATYEPTDSDLVILRRGYSFRPSAGADPKDCLYISNAKLLLVSGSSSTWRYEYTEPAKQSNPPFLFLCTSFKRKDSEVIYTVTHETSTDSLLFKTNPDPHVYIAEP